MKINTNSFGNYSKTYIDKTAAKPAAEKTNSPSITDAEKKFLLECIPHKKMKLSIMSFIVLRVKLQV